MIVTIKKEHFKNFFASMNKVFTKLGIEDMYIDELVEANFEIDKLLGPDETIESPVCKLWLEGDNVHIEYSDEFISDSLELFCDISMEIADFADRHKDVVEKNYGFVKKVVMNIVWPVIKHHFSDLIEDGKKLIEKINAKLEKFSDKYPM